MEDARVNGRGGAQRIYQGHAEVHHRFDLASVVAVSVNAYVAAARDGHALPEGCLEDLALVRGVRAGDGERRAERRPALLHQPEQLRRPAVPVLYGLHAGQDGPPHPFRGGRVCRHRNPGALGSLDRELQLLE